MYLGVKLHLETRGFVKVVEKKRRYPEGGSQP